MVIAQGTDILPLRIADLVVEADHDPPSLALGFKVVFLKTLFIPPINPLSRFLREGNVVERQRHIEGIQGGGEFPGKAGFAELLGVLPLVGAVDPAKILFPKGVPGAFYVGGVTDAGSALADPKISCDNVPFYRERSGTFGSFCGLGRNFNLNILSTSNIRT